nr:MAG TPA: hypothetical protein [Caudoviricetes sp.]
MKVINVFNISKTNKTVNHQPSPVTPLFFSLIPLMVNRIRYHAIIVTR